MDAILHRVMGAVDDRIDSGTAGDKDRWTMKLIELVNVAIDAWANNSKGCGEAVSRAEGWFKMLQQRIAQTSASDMHVSICLGDDALKLFEESYRGIIKAYIRSHETLYLDKAIELLEELRMYQHISQTDPGTVAMLYPTTQTYNLVLYGLANCKPCAKNAEQILSRYQHSTRTRCEVCLQSRLEHISPSGNGLDKEWRKWYCCREGTAIT